MQTLAKRKPPVNIYNPPKRHGRVLLTQTEFARKCGISDATVWHHVRAKNIVPKVINGRRWFDPEVDYEKFLAMATMRLNGKTASGFLRKKKESQAVPVESVKSSPAMPQRVLLAGERPIAVRNQMREQGEKETRNKKMSVIEAREQQEHYKALQAKLEYDREVGAVVDVEEIRREWSEHGMLIRKALLNIADRLSPVVAAESDARLCWAILDSECRQILEDLADAIKRGKTAAHAGSIERSASTPEEVDG